MAKYTETRTGDLRRTYPDTRTVVDHGLAARHGGRRGAGFRASKWGGQYWCELRDADARIVGRGLDVVTHPVHGECLEGEFRRSLRGRDRGEWHRFRDGSTEWEIVWANRDDVPEYVDLLIDAPAGVTWHRQPALTQEEIDEGCERPENVVNSYAVYAPVSGRWLTPAGEERVNYETGKLMHVYRSWLADSAGNRVWLDQSAPLGDPPRLRITIPPELVAAMLPPIICGPTIGYTSVGSTEQSTRNNVVNAHLPIVPPSSSGTITAIAEYTATSSITITTGVYSDSSGSPGDLLAVGTPVSSVIGWTTSPATLAITAGVTYWLAEIRGGTTRLVFDSVPGTFLKYSFRTYDGAFPNPFGTPIDVSDRMFSLYATYTETPSGHVPHAAVLRNHLLGA